jgi:hypothetical protein
MRLRKPVQQEDGRSRPGVAQKNTRFLRLHLDRYKILKCGRTRHHIASGRRSFLNVANISTKSKIPSGICDGILPARVKVRKGLGQMNRTHSLPPERWGEK